MIIEYNFVMCKLICVIKLYVCRKGGLNYELNFKKEKSFRRKKNDEQTGPF